MTIKPPSKLLQKMLTNAGSKGDFRKNSVIGEIFARTGIRKTAELERIARLPRRDWHDLLRDNYTEILSAHLRRPGSTATLFDEQAAALTEFHDYGGFLGNIGLGVGKTLITALAPVILGAENPILVAPGGLRTKTVNDFKRYQKDWVLHPRMQFVSYEQISRNPQLLIELAPDCLIFDEVHCLKNLKAGCTKRVKKYKNLRPRTPFMGLSGTLSTRSLREIWHLFMWALLPERMPLPRNYDELEEWALAVDEKVDAGDRMAPGELIPVLGKGIEVPIEVEDHEKEIVHARMAVSLRLEQTAGYMSSAKLSCNASMSLTVVIPPKSHIIEDAIATLRSSMEDNNGDVLLRPADIWAKARMLACGFQYVWDPPAPETWRKARKNWHRYVRHALEAHSRLVDTPMHVAQYVDKGELKTPFDISEDPEKPLKFTPQELLMAWRLEQPHYKYKLRPEWIDISRAEWIVRKYLQEEDDIIVWVEHGAMGRKLAELSGRPFYHNHGFNAVGEHIEQASGPIISSVKANHFGVNLQQFTKNFIVSTEPSGKTMEQLMGRTHRTGQDADHISYEIMEGCKEHREGLIQILRDAHYAHQTFKQPQRLLLADKINF